MLSHCHVTGLGSEFGPDDRANPLSALTTVWEVRLVPRSVSVHFRLCRTTQPAEALPETKANGSCKTMYARCWLHNAINLRAGRPRSTPSPYHRGVLLDLRHAKDRPKIGHRSRILRRLSTIEELEMWIDLQLQLKRDLVSHHVV